MTSASSLPIKVVTFDLDDTLWPLKSVLMNAEKSTYGWIQQHAPAIAKHFSQESLIDYRQQFFARHLNLHHQISALRQRSYEEIARLSGYTKEQSRSIAQQAFDVFIKLRQQVVYYEDTVATLEQLSANYFIGAVTNGNANVFQMSISSYFDFSVSAEQAGCSKPDKGIFQSALALANKCAAMNLHAQQVVHVGDGLLYDVFGARNAGLKSVWFNQGNQFSPVTSEEHQYAQKANASVAKLADLLALDLDQI